MLDQNSDLTFAPSPERDGLKLSEEQIAHYNTEGFLQPFDVFSETEITEIRSYLDRLMADLGPDGAYGVNCYQARLSGLWDTATDARILDHVQDIIGSDILCWASAILSKKPHDPKAVSWHQDASFWALSPARTVTDWLAIDDADAENFAMRFIPRTHNQGAMEVQATGGKAVFHKETANAEAVGTPF